MIRSSFAAVAASAVVLAGAGAVGAAVGAASSGPVVSPTVSSSQISHDGRYVWDDETSQVVDRLTGARSAAPSCSGDHCQSAGFVRDNPKLVLTFEYGPKPVPGEAGDGEPGNKAPLIGVYLTDTATGARTRIDADSAGVPLVASWQNQGSCGNEWCDNFYDYPDVFVSVDSVSKDGRRVAFCTNYAQPKVPALYVKDLRSGRLTRTGLRCPIVHHPEGLYTRPAQISADGRVVHVNGDYRVAVEPKFNWNADRLYFTRSGTVRTVNGWGSMTRSGGAIFMRLGVSPVGSGRSVAWDRLRTGVYDVKTRRVTRLPSAGNRIYGHGVELFSAFDHASYRGRFVVAVSSVGGSAPDRATVIDRRTGARADITAVLRAKGYTPFREEWDPIISANGKVVLATVTSGDPARVSTVAVTGWEPTARATVRTNAARTKLLVNVDPDKGSGYWTFRVQAKRADGTWRTLKKTYRTQGARETRTIDLGAGTYRVVVKAKYGYLGSTSGEAVLVR